MNNLKLESITNARNKLNGLIQEYMPKLIEVAKEFIGSSVLTGKSEVYPELRKFKNALNSVYKKDSVEGFSITPMVYIRSNYEREIIYNIHIQMYLNTPSLEEEDKFETCFALVPLGTCTDSIFDSISVQDYRIDYPKYFTPEALLAKVAKIKEIQKILDKEKESFPEYFQFLLTEEE